jgi:hypothetical protein
MKNKSIVFGLGVLCVPSIVLGAMSGLRTFLGDIVYIIGLLGPLIGLLASIFFFWGVAQFILHSNEEKTRDDGKKKMLWGIIAVFVLFSINGILSIVGDTLGIPANTSKVPSSLPPGSTSDRIIPITDVNTSGGSSSIPGGSGSRGVGGGSNSNSFNPPDPDCGNGTDVLCVQDQGDGSGQ